MVFSSLVFLFIFLPLTLLVNSFIAVGRLKNLFLMLASLLFYVWGEMQYAAMMFISILINFSFGLMVDGAKTKQGARLAVGIAVSVNLLLLIFFKYGNFLADNMNVLLKAAGFGLLHLNPIHLPIGISFFTFHSISYIVDIYRKEAEAERSPVNLALYISFFPQLIAGPIIRYHDIADQIRSRLLNRDQFTTGIRRFITGLGKKVLIANTLAGVADQVFAIPANELHASVAWIGLLAYSLQIYFDFSGYSDMAIGMAKMFGFEFLENFNYPYIATSVKEFWRRWHISLSNWFRDYVYIPLGGNRAGGGRTYLHLLIVFFLTGLWHGASWNFIAWGMMHGALMLAERAGLEKLMQTWWKPVRHVYLLLFICLAWVFFRSGDFSYSLAFIKSLFGFGDAVSQRFFPGLYLNRQVILVFIVGILGSMPVIISGRNRLQLITGNWKPFFRIPFINTLQLISYAGLIIVFLLSTMTLVSGTYNPFIYFRF